MEGETGQALTLAEQLRHSRWGYAAVNATHVLGIALLVGAIVPYDLRRLGCWRGVPEPALRAVLVPMAGAGLALAISAGLLLFSVRSGEYLGNPFFLAKIALVACGIANAALFHAALRHRSARLLRLGAAASLTIWIAALFCGRMIAFAD